METVNSLTSAASRAIWGDPKKNADSTQNEEPVSGETGDVSAGEPYDKGNTEPTSTPADTDSANPTISSTTDTNTSTSTMPSDSTKLDMPSNMSATLPIRSEHETSKTGVTSTHEPTSSTSTDKPTSSNDTSGTEPTPSVGTDLPSASQETQKQQSADSTTDEPAEGNEEHDRIVATKKAAEKVDTSGPGPRLLSEVKGDAATKGDIVENEPQTKSYGEGTGTKYVQSSGVKADGGNFDAANPGAGIEADRFVDTKGAHHEAPIEPQSEDSKDTNGSSGGKLSGLKEKIKAKLHKN